MHKEQNSDTVNLMPFKCVPERRKRRSAFPIRGIKIGIKMLAFDGLIGRSFRNDGTFPKKMKKNSQKWNFGWFSFGLR